MTKSAQYLKELADHFEYRDWNYTRNSRISQIRYEKEYDIHNKISYRIKQAAWWMFGKTPEWYAALGEKNSLARRFRMAMHCLRREAHTPDGVLDSGNIITYWEETGEYLNMIQPTVGTLVADFIIAEPDHPHAILINKELDRLRKNYNKRIKAGEVS